MFRQFQVWGIRSRDSVEVKSLATGDDFWLTLSYQTGFHTVVCIRITWWDYWNMDFWALALEFWFVRLKLGPNSGHLFFFLPFFLNFLMFIYFWRGGGAQRERETQSEADSRLWAVSAEPEAGLELTSHEIMTWTKVWCWTYWATDTPGIVCISKEFPSNAGEAGSGPRLEYSCLIVSKILEVR